MRINLPLTKQPCADDFLLPRHIYEQKSCNYPIAKKIHFLNQLSYCDVNIKRFTGLEEDEFYVQVF